MDSNRFLKDTNIKIPTAVYKSFSKFFSSLSAQLDSCIKHPQSSGTYEKHRLKVIVDYSVYSEMDEDGQEEYCANAVDGVLAYLNDLKEGSIILQMNWHTDKDPLIDTYLMMVQVDVLSLLEERGYLEEDDEDY